jgi:hypothetical protein
VGGDTNFNRLKALWKLSPRLFERVVYTYKSSLGPALEVRRRFLENWASAEVVEDGIANLNG